MAMTMYFAFAGETSAAEAFVMSDPAAGAV
jgi:hypothetical protein